MPSITGPPMTSPLSSEDTWRPQRLRTFLLWIDGVGGYLVCTEPRVTLGKSGDLALLADVSRHHAAIQRDAEGYFLEATRKVTVNGTPVERALLRSGDRITLGTSCQLLFTQPVPLSASARLDVVSGHRLAQPVSAALLFAETLVLGRGPQAHVVVEELERPVILFRARDGLAVRSDGNLTIDGQPCRERGLLSPNARVVTERLSFALESV